MLTLYTFSHVKPRAIEAIKVNCSPIGNKSQLLQFYTTISITILLVNISYSPHQETQSVDPR